jgi:hypothetical protein
MRLFEDRFILQKLHGLWEKTGVFIVGMGLQKFMPSQAIPDEVGFIGVHDVRCLVVDRIVPPKDRVVHHAHVARTTGKQVALTGKLTSPPVVTEG